MPLISSVEVLCVIQRCLNYVDARLVEHGARVAYLTGRLLQAAGERDAKRLRDACMVTLLHDIGAYKTEEIDKMVRFETQEVWHHSIYGYLFLNYMSPLAQLAPAVLFHHLEYERLKLLDTACKDLAQMIHLADRIDTYLAGKGTAPGHGILEQARDKRFSGAVLDLLYQAEHCDPWLYQNMLDNGYWMELEAAVAACPFSEEEINAYLRMVVASIDFRSQHTVTHTITTERISQVLADRLELPPEQKLKVRYGALVHDLGKIAIPVEILEYPGKLSPQAMQVMKTHVDRTEEILGLSADQEMLHIAVRHHEKLDGSGYPRGLTGDELTPADRIVATADIVSALVGTRSYKGAFEKERVISILSKMSEDGLICRCTVKAMLDHYDEIMDEVAQICAPVLQAYELMQRQFSILDAQYAYMDQEILK